MATTVGVRELRENAPSLVKRAARGERILITRYGRPTAELGPAPSAESGGRRRRVEQWEREKRAFDRMLPRLLERMPGRWVAVSGGRVVGSDTDEDRLYDRVSRKLRGRTFHMGRVSPVLPAVEMPGFEIE